MKLFDILPERLFRVLAAPSKALYAHVLFLLYDLYKQSLYGIERGTVLDQITAYLETEAVDLTADHLEGADSGALTPREKANAILRDYAIKLLDVLDAVRSQKIGCRAWRMRQPFTHWGLP